MNEEKKTRIDVVD